MRSIVFLFLLACPGNKGDTDPDVDAVDADNDGFAVGEDCNDADDAIHPDATEVCDFHDNDCNGLVDDDDAGTDPTTQDDFFPDEDGDGYGAGEARLSCGPLEGHVANSADCDDTNAEISPLGFEDCDGLDNDCDGLSDGDDPDFDGYEVWYPDDDDDGWGREDEPVEACEAPPLHTAQPGDCDDTRGSVNPDATETVGNERDDDCDGEELCFADSDSDGFRSSAETEASVDADCDDAGEAKSSVPIDCDDADDERAPGLLEPCDGKDNDCNFIVDDDPPIWFRDLDGDTFGDPDSTTGACEPPEGFGIDASDCDDTNGDVNPLALEVCDGQDNDCDGSTDDDGSWWDPAWPYRASLTLDPQGLVHVAPVVTIDVSFADLLAELGDESGLAEAATRVVHQSCALGQPEIPSQYLDTWLHPLGHGDPDDEALDGIGSLVFVYDEDETLFTEETLGETVTLAIYFGSNDTASGIDAPEYETDLSGDFETLTNSRSTATLDTSVAGLLGGLTTGSSPVLVSQAASTDGNGLFAGGDWSNSCAGGFGITTVVLEGSVMRAVQTLGFVANGSVKYDCTYTWIQFATRPQLYVHASFLTKAAITVDHPDDYTYGIRPWQARHDTLTGGTISTGAGFVDMSTADFGITTAWVDGGVPTFDIRQDAVDPEVAFIGNDWQDEGSGTPGLLPSQRHVVDGVTLVLFPHEGDFASVESEFLALQAGVSATLGSPEAR